MTKKLIHLSICLLPCMMVPALRSCSKDKDDEPTNNSKPADDTPSSPIVGTWTYSDTYEGIYDNYTLVFNNDNTGYIRNDWGTRTSYSQQMNFDWSLTMTSDGTYRLSVIYKSGDYMDDGPFEGSYAQFNREVTIAGRTLSIKMSDSTVMLFTRQ